MLLSVSFLFLFTYHMQFNDLVVWKLAKEITIVIYQAFQLCKDFGFKDQIQRASVSVMNNIAEWFERWTLKDKQRFFIIAKWSVAEVRSMLLLCEDLWYLEHQQCEELLQKTYSISSMLQKLITNSKF